MALLRIVSYGNSASLLKFVTRQERDEIELWLLPKRCSRLPHASRKAMQADEGA